MKRLSFLYLGIIAIVGFLAVFELSEQNAKADDNVKIFVFAKGLTDLVDPMLGIDGNPISVSISNQPSIYVDNWDNVNSTNKQAITEEAHKLGFFDLINGSEHTHPIYAQISSTQNQLVNGVNTPSNVTFNSNDELLNIGHNTTTNNHIITIQKTGSMWCMKAPVDVMACVFSTTSKLSQKMET